MVCTIGVEPYWADCKGKKKNVLENVVMVPISWSTPRNSERRQSLFDPSFPKMISLRCKCATYYTGSYYGTYTTYTIPYVNTTIQAEHDLIEQIYRTYKTNNIKAKVSKVQRRVAAESRGFESVSALIGMLFDAGQSDRGGVPRWALIARTDKDGFVFIVIFMLLESSERTCGEPVRQDKLQRMGAVVLACSS